MTWTRREAITGRALVPVLVLLLALMALAICRIGDVGLVILPICLLVAMFVVLLSVVTIRIDEERVTARLLLGLTIVDVPLSDLEHVSIREVRALREFAGWGVRHSARHGHGVVLRSGSALILHGRSGQRAVLAVRNAHAAAHELERRGVPAAHDTGE